MSIKEKVYNVNRIDDSQDKNKNQGTGINFYF